MNKTENVSIGRHGFVCEQDAYKLLQEYLERSRKVLKQDPDSDEILNDLEQSMAGHLHDLSGKLIVDEHTAKKVIELMGEVAPDTASGDNLKHEPSDSYARADHAMESFSMKLREAFRKPLVKDRSHKVVDGVCAGIANALEIDPLWVRIAFVVLAFATKGFGIVAYIVLSIIMQDESKAKSKTAEQIVETVKEKVTSNQQIKRYESILSRFIMGAVRLAWGIVRGIVVLVLVVVAMAWASSLFFMLSSPKEVSILGGNIGWLDIMLAVSAGIVLLVPLLELLISMFRVRSKARITAAMWSIWALSLIVMVASFANVYPKVRHWAISEKPKNDFVYVEAEHGEIQEWCFSPLGTCKNSIVPLLYQQRCGLDVSVYNKEDRVEWMSRQWEPVYKSFEVPVSEEIYCATLKDVLQQRGPGAVIFADEVRNDPSYIIDRPDPVTQQTKKYWDAEFMIR